MNDLEIRKDIQILQKIIEMQPNAFHGDSDNCPLKHSFCDGFYVREIFIPKGTVVVGKIHKHAHPNFLMSGVVSVVTEEGNEIIEAPKAMISKAGTKRAVLALEDCVWITVHLNPENTQDLSILEDQIISKDYKSLGMEGDLQCLGSLLV